MAKNNRHGQAEILKDLELDRIYRQLQSDSHRLFFNIARYTGERFGAICQLQVCDVYVCYSGIKEPLNEITFRAMTRKASPNGERKTRQAYVCDRLREYLSSYRGELGKVYLFPSSIKKDDPITFSAADKWLRTAVDRAGLEHRGISTHTFRRSFITKLYEEGALDIYAIQQLIGHASILTTQRYLGVSKQKIQSAMNRIYN
ncbi:site-specific recombinase XerD [Synechococcus sp. PCC 7502]|uniref:tyrosine-type recombinase/integrase n=1 Tax=Synechococcus sp. PCC 7502 TaxID=1173263 RepID=UPI00029F8E93|nr:tyrosine-type recombinase/integrase [Synechococcus sp. PCC 7502]AFY75251.1 site-specific recombinase XerD [Synechococcus sp. PCC 7502]